MPTLPAGFRPFALPALAVAPLGIPPVAFWIYVCAAVVLILGLIRILPQLGREHGVDKIMPFGRLFYAIPMAVFASEHFTLTKTIAAMVPRWIPGHVFWAYLVGTAFLCAALSIATLVQARLAAALLGMTFLIFVLTIDLPGTLAHPSNRFFWALTLRELSFSGGALALAISLWNRRPRASENRAYSGHTTVPRLFICIASLFYGVENLLHPAFLPGVPLRNLTPEWIHGRFFVSYLVGVVLILAGLCLFANRKSRLAATALGLTILLAIVWVYLPMLVAAPTDLLALNYFFDTLLFCGTVLLLANAMERGNAATADSARMTTQGHA